MAIIIADPGDAILSNAIEGSWDTVRTQVNNQSAQTLRRDALNGFQLPRIIARQTGTNRGRDYKFTNTPVVVSSAYVGTSSADIRNNWQNVLTLNGSTGTGYAHGACWGIICASVHVGDSVLDNEGAALMAVTVETNGGLANKIEAGDWRYSMLEDMGDVSPAFDVDTPSFYDLHGYQELDTSMHLWTVYTAGTATLTAVKLWVATTNILKPWTMDNASLSLYLFNRVP